MEIIKLDWKETIFLVKGSNVKVAHNQEELLTVFEKHKTSDITIVRRKLK